MELFLIWKEIFSLKNISINESNKVGKDRNFLIIM